MTPLQVNPWLLDLRLLYRADKQTFQAIAQCHCLSVRPTLNCQVLPTLLSVNLIFIGSCIIVIVENKRPTWCHLLFYFTSYVLNMFWTLIYPSSGACDYSVELPHWSCVLGSMCFGVSVLLGWHWICVVVLPACNTDTTPSQPHRNTKNTRPMW